MDASPEKDKSWLLYEEEFNSDSIANKKLIEIMSDGNWHSTIQLVILAGIYFRPEVAFRIGIGKDFQRRLDNGLRKCTLHLLRRLKKMGKVESKMNEGLREWRFADLTNNGRKIL